MAVQTLIRISFLPLKSAASLDKRELLACHDLPELDCATAKAHYRGIILVTYRLLRPSRRKTKEL